MVVTTAAVDAELLFEATPTTFETYKKVFIYICFHHSAILRNTPLNRCSMDIIRTLLLFILTIDL